jgi:protein TonB
LSKKKNLKWIFPATGGALLANVALLLMVSFLASERKPPQDITEPVGINLVELAPPEAPKQENIKKPEPPKPKEQQDFTPDLVRPSFAGPGALLDGIAIDLGGLNDGGLKEEFVFEAYELDQPPQPIAKIPPLYPYKARERGIEGAVQVKILVNADGSVGQVLVLEARPQGMFEESVIKAVPKWKFNPGVIEGQAVTAWVVTTLRFTLDD